MIKLFLTLSLIFSATSALADICETARRECAERFGDDTNARSVQLDQLTCICMTKSGDQFVMPPEIANNEALKRQAIDQYNATARTPLREVAATQDGPITLSPQQRSDLEVAEAARVHCNNPSNRRANETVSACIGSKIEQGCQGNPACVGRVTRSVKEAEEGRHDTGGLYSAMAGGGRGDTSPGTAADPEARTTTSSETTAKYKFTPDSINGLTFDAPKKLRRGDEDFEFGEDPDLNDTIGYSKFHSFCEGELPSGQMWEQSQARDAEGYYKESMNEFLASAKEEFVEKHGTDGISLQDLKAWFKKYNDQIQDRGKAYTYCTALMGSLQGNVNYSEKNSGGNGGEYIIASATKPDLKCVTYMYETADFAACRSALNAFDAAFIAEQGMGVYQQFDFQSKNMDRQMDLQKKQMKGGTIDTTDALGVQKSATEDQAVVAKQRAAFDAAKLGTLTMMLSQIPDQDKIEKSCKQNAGPSIEDVKRKWLEISDKFHTWTASMIASNNGAQLVGLAGETPSHYNPNDTAVGTACGAFYNKRGSSSVSVQLLRNQEIKDKIKAEMVKAGVSMASHIAKAALLEKQADEIQDVMNSIKKFEPPPFPENQMTEMQVLECQANPNAAGCGTLSGPNARGFDGNGISLGASQFATSDGEAIDLNDPNAQNNNSANSKTDRADRSRRLGSAAGDAAAESGILNPVAAAEVKKGGGNPGGGAGGGPGAAGGAAPGASGGKPGQGGAGGAYGSSVSKVNYKGAGGGSLNYSGGYGAARKPAAKADNPFANLLGNKGGSKSGVLDGFRGPASGIGNKDDGLFQMISNRYSRISGDKDRLMQYEIKK